MFRKFSFSFYTYILYIQPKYFHGRIRFHFLYILRKMKEYKVHDMKLKKKWHGKKSRRLKKEAGGQAGKQQAGSLAEAVPGSSRLASSSERTAARQRGCRGRASILAGVTMATDIRRLRTRGARQPVSLWSSCPTLCTGISDLFIYDDLTMVP